MKLYYSPAACSLASHIVAREAGIPVELDKVDRKAKRTASGEDFLQINPKGYVPALVLDNGELLTEGTAIVQYLADQKPETALAPANGTTDRYRLQEMLAYINSELHKAYSPLFEPETPESPREKREAGVRKLYALIEQRLSRHEWLVGDRFSAADAYLFTVTNWAKPVKLDLSDFPAVQAFQKRVASRPKVREALVAEGLVKA